jgi:TonB family protein
VLPAVEQALAMPTIPSHVDVPSGPAVDAALLRGLGDLTLGGAHAAYGHLASENDGGAAPVVSYEVLATPPQMLNRRTITRVMSEEYPQRLMWGGVEGEVVVAFIIGVDGRAEMDHVQVVSATNPAFVPAALRGLRSMRFRPAELDGRRVRVRVTLPLMWKLPANA